MTTRLLLLILLPWFSIVALGVTITLPSYIPHPGAWAEVEPPARPSPWTSEQAGYYFIDRAEAGATDSGRTYGYPGAARLTIPSSIPAGSYVEIAGAYVTGTKTITGAGTSDAWSANSAGPAWVVTCPTNQATFDDTTRLRGTYLYVKGIWFYNDRSSGDSAAVDITMNGTPPAAPHHILVRDCRMDGDGIHQTHGLVTYGTAGNVVSNVVVMNCAATNHGDMAAVADVDAFGFWAAQYSDSVWFLTNSTFRTVGSTIRLGAAEGQPITQRRTFIHGGLFNYVREHGIWAKVCADVIISQTTNRNTIEAPPGSPSAGPGAAIGGQYGLSNLWVINNVCSDSMFGIRFPSGLAGPIYAIGNLCVGNDVGIIKASSQPLYLYNNTVIGSTNVGIDDGAIASGALRLVNNIVTGRASGSAYDISIAANYDSETSINTNIIYSAAGSARILWNATTYDVAGLISATATGDGCLEQDPLLSGTYALQDGSPAIGAALAWESLPTSPWDDFEAWWGITVSPADQIGTARPSAGLDIGALEYVAGSRRATFGGGAVFRNATFP